jgi:hypothetical protein
VASKLQTLQAIVNNANAVLLNDGSTVANVQNDSAPTKPAATAPTLAVYKIDGFSWTFNAGNLSDDLVKATVTRDTTNPWYVVVCAIAKQTAGYLTITRDDNSKAKAPTSQIWGAILRAQKLDVKGSRKLTVKSGKDKGVWYLVHVA